jgi:uncharacterized membrane protein YGL010W
MRTLTDHLSTYAAYHRDRRNIATHFVGIPMIVLAVATLLSRPAWTLGGVPLTPALAVSAGAFLFYLALDVRYALAMAAVLTLSLWGGGWIAAQSTTNWLVIGIGLFVVGWAIQFIGHAFEGRKPAFVDDLIGLLVGPLFLVAETGFALGLGAKLHETILAKVGPTWVRPSGVAPRALQ